MKIPIRYHKSLTPKPEIGFIWAMMELHPTLVQKLLYYIEIYSQKHAQKSASGTNPFVK